MTVEIRCASAGDISQVSILQQEFLEEHEKVYDALFYKKSIQSRDEWSMWLSQKLQEEDFVLFIAEENKKMLGYITGMIEQRPAIYMLRKIGYISNLYTTPEARGKKVATKLHTMLLKWFQEKKVEHVELNVDSRANGAVHTWEVLGYKEVGKRMRKTIV